jgi:molybdopterin-guanine dinucleotide biosynthesis protein A
MSITPENITALILAGGKSSRMGQDKGLLPFGNSIMVGHVIEQIRPQVGRILISANRNQDKYAKLGHKIIGDPIEGFQGPLAGFLAGLEAIQTDYLITLPCDGPFVLSNYVERMSKGLFKASADIAVAHDGKRLQPVHVLLHRKVTEELKDTLEQGERKIDRWFPQHAWVTVDFSDAPQQFDNINTPKDYKSASGAEVA